MYAQYHIVIAVISASIMALIVLQECTSDHDDYNPDAKIFTWKVFRWSFILIGGFELVALIIIIIKINDTIYQYNNRSVHPEEIVPSAVVIDPRDVQPVTGIPAQSIHPTLLPSKITLNLCRFLRH
jgi:hypothetical protein